MKDYKGEEILVVTRALFDSLGDFQGINTDVDHYLPSLLNPENNFFMDRGAAEDDPSHKQLIPYCIFRVKDENGTRYLHYTRGKSGGESRLHAQVSIGIGGHINPVDTREDHLGRKTYMAGVEREIDEELNIVGGHTNKIVALLNDDSNPVGQVHLGVVHMIDLENDNTAANEDSIANLAFTTLEELRGDLYDRLETWTRCCVDVIEEL
ncbi:phosphoesterase [Oceaniferula spumae]|uniref:Phosphoesterase n=1 Tax=Oceaniferula spumae TaxID=2979115 RepID=A0AAT9FHZ5_9BACT